MQTQQKQMRKRQQLKSMILDIDEYYSGCAYCGSEDVELDSVERYDVFYQSEKRFVFKVGCRSCGGTDAILVCPKQVAKVLVYI